MNVVSHRFKDKVCIVTGGAKGIGAAIAMRLGVEGCLTVIFDIDQYAGEYRVREFSEKGIKAVFYKVDVSREDEVSSAVEDVYRRYNKINVLINNAGIGFSGKSLEEQTFEEWMRVINTNLTGPWLCSKHVIKYMKKSGGVIINISSTRAIQSEPNTEPYSASKGGLLALTHAMAISLSKYKIRVIAVSPGWVDTSLWQIPPRKPELTNLDHMWHPAGRVGRPEDIASLIAFLASEEAEWITGVNIIIDGGVSIRMIYPDEEMLKYMISILLEDASAGELIISLIRKIREKKEVLDLIKNILSNT